MNLTQKQTWYPLLWGREGGNLTIFYCYYVNISANIIWQLSFQKHMLQLLTTRSLLHQNGLYWQLELSIYTGIHDFTSIFQLIPGGLSIQICPVNMGQILNS